MVLHFDIITESDARQIEYGATVELSKGGHVTPLAQDTLRERRITVVPAGSVGIAGQQTGIYSVDSPGGWRLIGWTPLKLFDPQRQPASLLAPGDVVRFVEQGAG